jgi:hypothetical protein
VKVVPSPSTCTLALTLTLTLEKFALLLGRP